MPAQTKKPPTSEVLPDAPRLTLAQKLLIITSEIAGIQQTGKHAKFNFKYYTDEDIVNGIRPLLTRLGVMILPSVTRSEIDGKLARVEMSFDIINAESPEECYNSNCHGIGVDKGVSELHGTALKAAITSAVRYWYMKTFNLSDHIDDEQFGDDTETSKGSEGKYGTTVSTKEKNGMTGKETAKNGESKPGEKSRPLSAEDILAGYNKMALTNPLPISSDGYEKLKSIIGALVGDNEEDKAIIKRFFSLRVAKDCTVGRCNYIEQWVNPKISSDGMVSISPYAQKEFEAIKEFILQSEVEI